MTKLLHYSKIPPNLSQEIETAKDRAAGGLIISKSSGNILLGLRSNEVESPNKYGVFGGRFDDFESPEEALEREIFEETGYPLFGGYKPLCVYYDEATQFAYHTQVALTDHDFSPELNWEHSEAKWLSLKEVLNIPEHDLHEGLALALSEPDVIKELTNITNHFKVKSFKNDSVEQDTDFSY